MNDKSPMAHPAMLICSLGENELSALLALDEACSSVAWSEAQWVAVLADAELAKGNTSVLGIWHEQQLAGYAVVVNLGWDAELQAITVAPAWRRQGLGQQLLAGVIDSAVRWASERLLLEVRAGNAPALALYYQAGFVLDGIRQHYYPPREGVERENACLMSLSLASNT
ncbi:GNAT family N-acetyltransferase [Halomonas halocynthiae]|uniref:GNAT family N-acetyltransferase n=1 Tax=Halomonas halocynthiae TaxID=176290 RepID=UPI0004233688|nr:GNAT family N-acetyltransferase [Halomonas halocynthiae]